MKFDCQICIGESGSPVVAELGRSAQIACPEPFCAVKSTMKTKCSVLLTLIGFFAGCAHLQEAKVNLSTPESTVVGFTKAAAEGNAKLAQSYFLPGGVDYQDIWKTLTAEPGTPRYAARVTLEAVDPKGANDGEEPERDRTRLESGLASHLPQGI